jgi:putative flavoprotein involved in K+ transport
LTAVGRTGTVVVGAGQAGLALSRFLTRAGHDHVVLDRGRVGERWLTERWDALTLLTPAWLSELPGPIRHQDPDAFLGRLEFVDYLERYARSFSAPVHEGVSVLEVVQDGAGFAVETDAGRWLAHNVVVATGYADEPRVPAIAAAGPKGVLQLHSSDYRRPDLLPPGGVLVVGAGPSGQQLAAELRRAGRAVTIAAGRHAHMPRRYRGQDIWHWLAVTGHIDQTLDDAPHERDASQALSLVLSGAHGGERLDLGVLADLGVQVTGRLGGFVGSHALFGDGLGATVRATDSRQRRGLARIDWQIEELPHCERPRAQWIPPLQIPPGPRALDLDAANVSTVIWATGYGRSYPWLSIDVLGEDGEIEHTRGCTSVPGLYALGLRFQHRRKSHFIGGVGDDARFVAARILARPGPRPFRAQPETVVTVPSGASRRM